MAGSVHRSVLFCHEGTDQEYRVWNANPRYGHLVLYAPLLFGSSSGQPTINLPYTGFLQQVQQGNVKDVTLTGNAVSGDFKIPLRQQQSGSGTATAAYSQFTSFVPETGDPNLLPLLEKNGVSVAAQPV